MFVNLFYIGILENFVKFLIVCCEKLWNLILLNILFNIFVVFFIDFFLFNWILFFFKNFGCVFKLIDVIVNVVCVFVEFFLNSSVMFFLDK